MAIWRFMIVASLLVALFLFGLRELGIFQIFELDSYDQMVRLVRSDEPDPRLVVISIKESDIQEQQQWPLSDKILSELLSTIQKYHPKVIGLDIHRDIPFPPGHEKLIKQLEADNVIVITEIGGGNGASDHVPPPAKVPDERIGFNDFVLDIDNVLRRNLLYAEIGNKKYYSFALRVALKYLKEHKLNFAVKPDSLKIGQTKFNALNSKSGGYVMKASEAKGWQILMDYEGVNLVKQISLSDVLNKKIDLSFLKDKVVLIGTTAPSENDLFTTPYSIDESDYLTAGVMIHAQMVSQILSRVLDGDSEFWFWNEWQEFLWIWIWSLVGTFLICQFNSPILLGLSVIFSLLLLWGLCFGFFLMEGWVPLVPSAIALLVSSGVCLGQKVIYNSYYDNLTGLPNRRFFLKQIKQKDNYLMAILVLDVTRFRMINYILGQEAGDQILKETAKRLQSCINQNDTIARVGSDEFGIAQKGLNELTTAINLGEKLQKKFLRPFKIGNQDIFLDVTIGIAFAEEEKYFQPEELLRDAYIAMYRAKALEKTKPEVFVRMMYTEDLQRWQLENELRQAIKYFEFVVYYQPIISLKTLKIAGFEALVRWRSPNRGLVSPGEFINISEETGLIVPLGEWILTEACQQIRAWQQQFPEYDNLIMSVNLSSRQFTQTNLLQTIIKTCQDIGLDFSSLKLEITESTLIKDIDDSLNLLQKLQDLNFKLSLDDFGTGYSSFSYLHRLPLNTLKIDKSFVNLMMQAENYAEIVRTIVTLAHSLGMDVVAEGIETKEQLEKLIHWECEFGQGYLFSHPLSKDEATELLKINPQW